MVISVLIENTTISPRYASEHGLSLYIETDNHKILYDVGQSRKFLRNAKIQHINIADVDTVVISHGHYDHGDGLKYLLKKNKKCLVYIKKEAFERFYNAKGKYIGLKRKFLNNPQIVFVEDELEIDDELKIVSYANCKEKYQTKNDLTRMIDDQSYPDNFVHEQYMIVNERKEKTLFSGCSHRGLLNIIDWSSSENITTFVGGFHISKYRIDDLREIVENLRTNNILYYTCHCTGVEKCEYLSSELMKRVTYISTGQLVVI